MSVMEAEATGRAVITCNSTGCRNAVEEGVNGLLIPVKDEESLSGAMEFFLQNKDKLIEMGVNSRKYAEDNFDQNKINEHIFAMTNID